MTWAAIIGAVVGVAVISGGVIVLLATHALIRMEQYQRDLEGVEIDGGWLFDTNPDPSQHAPAEGGEGDRGGVRGLHNEGLTK